MTASTAPTQPPDKCPACGAKVTSMSTDGFREFACGKMQRISDGVYGSMCHNAEAAAIALRARVKELESDYAALEYLDHESSIGAAEVGRQIKELEAERDAALARAEKAEAEAQETYREFICPKCETEFEDDGKEHPNGLLCPECKGNVKGVIHPRTVKRYVSQSDWDTLTAELTAARARLAELQALADKWSVTAQAELDHFINTKQFWRDQRRLVWLDCASELRAALASGAESEVTK